MKQSLTTEPRTTPKYDVREVLYPWHPFYGKRLIVEPRSQKWEMEVYGCRFEEDDTHTFHILPAFFFDRTYCESLAISPNLGPILAGSSRHLL